MINEFDPNEEGVIGFNEFLVIMARRWDQPQKQGDNYDEVTNLVDEVDTLK